MSDTWRNWQPGEPNEWCTDEDCGLLAPGLWDGWVDASCTVHKIKSRGASHWLICAQVVYDSQLGPMFV